MRIKEALQKGYALYVEPDLWDLTLEQLRPSYSASIRNIKPTKYIIIKDTNGYLHILDYLPKKSKIVRQYRRFYKPIEIEYAKVEENEYLVRQFKNVEYIDNPDYYKFYPNITPVDSGIRVDLGNQTHDFITPFTIDKVGLSTLQDILQQAGKNLTRVSRILVAEDLDWETLKC